MTTAHLDYDKLADLAEGLLDDDAAASAERHLTGCDDCRSRAAEVAEVSRVLAAAPTPPMPADLVERLDAAIAAEAASHGPGRRPHRRFQYLAAAAAAVVVIGGGAVVARNALQDNSNSGAATQPPVQEPSRSHGGKDTRPNIQSAPGGYPVLHSGTNYTAAGLDAQVRAVLAAKDRGRKVTAAAPATLSECVDHVSREKDSGRTPLVVDTATYEGRPATVIVLPGADATRAVVVVAGPKCSRTAIDLISSRQVAR